MSDLLLIIERFNTNYPEFVTWGVVILLLLFGLILQAGSIKEIYAEWKLQQLLNNLGRESLHHVTFPDDMDGQIFVEHLVLTPKEILLLSVKQYKGLIFAADKIDLWTQVIGNKSYKFENPLHQLEGDVSTLNALLKNSKVAAKVLFINGSEFPKGKPENIVSVDDIKIWQRDYTAEEIPPALRTDWKRLMELAANDDLVKDKGELIDGEKKSGLNILALISVVCLIAAWLAMRLI